MPGSPDTGAREPQDSVSALGQTPAEMGARAEALAATMSLRPLRPREAEDAVNLILALAAGVGEPPDEDLGSAAENAAREAALASGLWALAAFAAGQKNALLPFDVAEARAVLDAAEGRLPNPAESSSAGVGEARPAEPPEDEPSDEQWCGDEQPHEAHPWSDVFCSGVSVGAPAEEQPDARATDSVEVAVREMLVALRLELPEPVWDDVYERTNALSVDRWRLREQLDAATKALQAYHDLAPALAECANDCGEALLYSDLKQANVVARAALGDVAAGESLEANSAKNAEVREGDKEAL